ncbi:Splicing factor-like protein [Trema orientale]|uniref:Splicing factor-like protein n=1 Tax=Trema orientale TaxID=63057 RepID=A0A2P5DN15_TREOI|nr:Splicing factor-like protein [Trema orientale]
MAETGIAGFSTPGSLDPRAEEFRPRNPTCPNHQLVLLGPPLPPPQLYYPYGSPYHPPPPPPPPLPMSEVHVSPFGDGGLGYPQQFSSAPGYVGAGGGAVAVRVPVPAMSSVSTRALLLSSVPSEVSESLVRRELEAFGEVRGVQMERLCDGIVTVHFYDLRHAESALREIRDQHMQHQTRIRNYHFMMSTSSSSSSNIATTNTTTATNPPLMIRNSGPEDPNWAASLPFPPVPPTAARGLLAGRAVWAHFVIPATNSIPDGFNQGTIVIFNLDSEVTTSTLKDTFQVFGPIKELRETPSKKHQKFIEFFDVRDAAKALKEMNGKQINGKEVVIEFSRPGGHSRKIMNAVTTTTHEYPPSPPLATRKLSGRPSFSMNIPPRSYAAHAHAQFPARKSSFGKGNGSKGSSSTMSSVERKMASLNLGPSVCNGSDHHHHHRERASSHGLPSKRFTRKTQNTTTQASSHHSPPPSPPVQAEQPQQLAPPLRSRSKKVSKQGKKFDSRFLISEDTMTESNCRDTRTTVMIKNIPNKYSQKLLLNMLDNHCIHCNEQIAAAAGDGGNDQPFSSYDFGLEALKEHFKNSKFPCEMDHYLPVVFTPPRDGRQLTEPLPIVGQSKQFQSIAVDHDHHDGGILDGQDDEVVVQENDNNDVFDGSNNDDDGVAADQTYQLSMMGHENSTGCSSLNGGVVLMSGVYNNDVNDDGDDDDQDRRQREIYMF